LYRIYTEWLYAEIAKGKNCDEKGRFGVIDLFYNKPKKGRILP